MKLLFKTLRDLCKSVPGIKWVDRDNGQLDQQGKRPTIPFPCVLIRTVFPTCSTVGGQNQLCDGQVVIRVAHDLAISETSNKAPDEASEASLAYLDMADSVYNKLQGYATPQITNLDRVSMVDEQRVDGLSVVRITFNCTFFDQAT